MLKKISLFVSVLALTLLFGYAVFAWVEPTAAPPGGNVAAPINVGNTIQSKSAGIGAPIFYDNPDNSYYLNPDGASVLGGPIGIGASSPESEVRMQLAGSLLNSGSNLNYYRDVAHYSNSNSAITGTLKITLPKSWSNTMMSIKIFGYDYSSATGAWDIIVGGYNYLPTTRWYNYSASLRGNAPFSQVRLAYDGTHNVILLGDLSTVWRYPKISISDFMGGYSNYTGWGSGWSISIISDEAGITNIYTPTITGGGDGTVTSVGLSMPTQFSVANSPVVDSGTLSVSWNNQNANLVMASPNGAAGSPTFRSLVSADIPGLDASKIISGVFSVVRGGTGLSASVEDAVMVGSGVAAWQAKVLPSCSDAINSKLLYNSATNSFSCGADQSGAGSTTPGGADGQMQYNNGGAFGGAANVYYDDANGILRINNNSGTSPFYVTRLGSTDQGLGVYADDRNLYMSYIEDAGEASPGTWHFVNALSGGVSHEFMTVNNLGNIGMGDTTPDAGLKLDVEGRVGATEYCDENGANCTPAGSLGGSGIDGSGAINYITKWQDSDTLMSSIMIDNGSKVGIGTTPQYGTLEVKPTAGDANTGITLYDGVNITARSWIGVGNLWHLTRGAGATTGITIDSAGNVGIGTIAPSAKLEVAGQVKITGGAPGAGKVLTSDATGLASWQALSSGNVDNNGGGTANRITKWLDADTLANSIITDDGSKIGIGGITSGALTNISGLTAWQLTLQDQGAGGGLWYLGSTADAWGAGGGKFVIDRQGSSAGAEFVIDSTGNVGIGDITPDGALKLDVEGQVGATAYCDQNGNNCTPATSLAGAPVGASYLTLALDGALTSERALTAGNGINFTDTGANGALTLSIDTNEAQARITGSCVAGNAIRAIAVDGTVTCQAVGGTSLWTDQGAYIYPNNYSNLVVTDTGRLGIGTVSPSEALDVAGDININWAGATIGRATLANGWLKVGSTLAMDPNELYFSANSYIGTIGANNLSIDTNGATRIYITSTGNVGVGNNNPASFKLQVAGDVGPNANLTYNLGSAALRWNKLYVQTIDPVYNIDGVDYATYVSDFAGGVRTETAGVLQLTKQGSDFSAVIDFEKAEKGSDLWLFWQTSNEDINDMVVLLTPSFNGKTWYEKQGDKLVIYSDKAGEVSYRLTLPREDNEDWSNLVKESK